MPSQHARRFDRFKRDYLPRWQLYLFLLVPIVYMLIFCYYPMAGIQIAFKKFNLTQGVWGSPWVGLRQFARFFYIPNLRSILFNTVFLAFYGILAGMPMPILLALVLNAFPHRRYRKLIQSVSYMPHFISTTVIVGMLMQLFNPRVGAVGVLYSLLFGKMMPDPFGQAALFPHFYTWSGIWQGVGWGSIIYIAALSAVDPELHESAEMDGASRFQRVIHLDFPCILPTVVIMMILSAGSLLNVGFDKVFLMQNRLNISRSEVISTYVYKVGLVNDGGDFSFSTAVDILNSAVNFTLLSLVNFIAKKVSGTSLW
jgi:putative aldouronate transport system permease protein